MPSRNFQNQCSFTHISGRRRVHTQKLPVFRPEENSWVVAGKRITVWLFQTVHNWPTIDDCAWDEPIGGPSRTTSARWGHIPWYINGKMLTATRCMSSYRIHSQGSWGAAAAAWLGQNHYFSANAKFFGQKPSAKNRNVFCKKRIFLRIEIKCPKSGIFY